MLKHCYCLVLQLQDTWFLQVELRTGDLSDLIVFKVNSWVNKDKPYVDVPAVIGGKKQMKSKQYFNPLSAQ